MEGVIDYEMRDVLTRLGGFDRCVTEFVRVTDQLLPNKVFFRIAPELQRGGKTPCGVPVYVQLLGGNPAAMAANALRLQKLEPPGIDINFGCPSKTVNKSDGGSVLLREPQRVGDIVAAVRDVVDPAIPVTAKIRLGFDHHDFLHEVVERVVEAGATELSIHARTRKDGYKPPAYWSAVKSVREKITIPLIINGEIWSSETAQLARLDSGCDDIMLGRGALSRPDLARQIADMGKPQDMRWPEVLALMLGYLQRTQNLHPRFVGNRAKQWLVYLQREYAEAGELFLQIKPLKEAGEVLDFLESSLSKAGLAGV